MVTSNIFFPAKNTYRTLLVARRTTSIDRNFTVLPSSNTDTWKIWFFCRCEASEVWTKVTSSTYYKLNNQFSKFLVSEHKGAETNLLTPG